jgi:hypothetical protein
MIEFGPGFIVASGSQSSYIVVAHLDQRPQSIFRLPRNSKGVEQILLLKDKLLLCFISEGVFYLVDLAQADEDELEVQLEIKVHAHQVKQFAVDPKMKTLALATTGSKVFMYDLPTALKNERALKKHK